MAKTTPQPLYPVYQELKSCDSREYPQLFEFLSRLPDWCMRAWSWGQEFLLYIGRNKSEHTFTRFRSEVEKFLLWTYLIKQKPLDELRKSDILDYADFCWNPPVDWICLANHEKFTFRNGIYSANPEWAPFRLVSAKGTDQKTDKRKYRPSQQSLQAMFTALTAFYKFLMDEEYCYGNPVQLAKKDCRYIIKDAQVKEVKRLSEAQWDYALDVAHEMADISPQYERNLFLVAALKSLFLRISELSERRDWIPVMGHFWQDHEKNWWLKIYGKGRKIRDITVPESFLDYLRRYRKSRGLTTLPYERENEPIVEKIRGTGGMTARQLSRLVQQVFDRAYDKMNDSHGPEMAQKFREVSSHWLRHTGASQEIERGRALKDVSEDLGHASMATTDTIYVQTEDKKRAESGKDRSV